MNVSLGQKWDQFVAGKVESGDFQTASEVLREGLRLLEKEELLKKADVLGIGIRMTGHHGGDIRGKFFTPSLCRGRGNA